VIPRQIPYRGVLEQNGAPVPSGTVAMRFDLWDAETGGASRWSEAMPAVAVQDGQFSVALGDTNPIPAAVLALPTLYLAVSVEGQALAGRQRLLTVPYAQKATTATYVVGAGTVNTTAVNASGAVSALTVSAGSTVSAPTVAAGSAATAPAFYTPYLAIGAGIGGGNDAGNLHLESNATGGDGRIYLNWFNGKGVVVGGGGLAITGNASVGGSLSVAGVEHQFKQDDCQDVILLNGGGYIMCPVGYYVAGVDGARSPQWGVYSIRCCK